MPLWCVFLTGFGLGEIVGMLVVLRFMPGEEENR